jgi:hypothetical protein
VRAGLAGFYNGLRAKIVQSVLAAAILFYIREEVYLAVRSCLPCIGHHWISARATIPAASARHMTGVCLRCMC